MKKYTFPEGDHLFPKRLNNVTVHLCTPSEYAEAKTFFKAFAWYEWLGFEPRGFQIANAIYAREDAIDLEGLIAHEIGHRLNLEHTPFPSTMNFTGLLRWTDPEDLRHLARIVIACAVGV